MPVKPLPRFLKHMNTVEVENLLATEAPIFLPIGTVEAHGRHLPVGTDTLCAEKISEELSITFSGAVAPSLEYGITNSLAQTAPASFFEESLYEKFIFCIIENYVKHGFKTIIIINGHGGNRDALKKVARQITRKHPVALSVINWWVLSEKFVKQIYGTSPGGHAAIEETAAILNYFPTSVVPDNYSPESDDYVPDDGIWLYPSPGEVLLHAPQAGQPSFDCGKAADFMEAVIDDLTQRLNKWFSSINRLSGGLRP